VTQKITAWIQASRLASQLYLLLPLTLGQLLATLTHGGWSSQVFVISLFYSLSLQFFIVYANDLADFETDKLNKNWTLFSGGSRVLVNKLLTPKELKLGLVLSLAISLFIALFLSYLRNNLFIFLLASLGPIMLWLYSYPPFKLSYRGGGEILQALGLSFVLPFLGFMLQKNSNFLSLISLCIALFPSQLACAMSTTIPDATSDSLSGKKTFVISFGPYKSFFLIMLLHSLSYFAIFFLIQKKLVMESATAHPLELILIYTALTSLMAYSFHMRYIKRLVFFSLSLTLFLIGYLIYLSFFSSL